MAVYLDPPTRQQLEAGARHLCALGPRALAEYLCEVAGKAGGLPAMLATAAEYRRIQPDVLRAIGGDRFPRHLRVVPSP